MLTNVTQSFLSQRSYLQNCRAEAMLRLLSLSIVLLCGAVQPFGSDRQELCVIQYNEVGCSYVAQIVD